MRWRYFFVWIVGSEGVDSFVSLLGISALCISATGISALGISAVGVDVEVRGPSGFTGLIMAPLSAVFKSWPTPESEMQGLNASLQYGLSSRLAELVISRD